MHLGVVAGERRRRCGQPATPQPRTGRRSGARWERPVGQPPEQQEADGHGGDAPEEKHPLEADEAAGAVHELEAGRDEADDGGGELGGGEVDADALGHARRRVEEG